MISDVDMVFRDLTDSFNELLANKDSPRIVRKKFTEFVIYSIKLTSIMRKEYKKNTGKNWNAKEFPDWDDISDLFYELRNTDQHEIPIRVRIRDTFSFNTDRIFLTSGEIGKEIVFEGDWDLENPSSDKIPKPITIYLGEPDDPSTEIIEATRRNITYCLVPSPKKIEDMLEIIGNNDIFFLVGEYYQKLTNYFEFYTNMLASN